MVPRMIPHGPIEVFNQSSTALRILGRWERANLCPLIKGEATPWDDGAAWRDFCVQPAGQQPPRSEKVIASSGCRPRN